MKIVNKVENGPVLLRPDIFKDDRGYFYESFNDKFFRENVCDATFVQDNQSRSSYGVIRGMHFQKGEYAQAKLVRVVKGAVLDVVLDIRKGTENYGKFYAYLLTEENHHQLFVPRGFAHGFVSLKDDTIFQYKCDNVYNKESEGSYRYDSFGFDWLQYVQESDMKFSQKDLEAPKFDNSRTIIEIPKERLFGLLFEYRMPAGLVSDEVSEMTEDIYADIQFMDGQKCSVKVDAIGPYYSIGFFDPMGGGARRLFCTRLDTKERMVLSPNLNEVIRFYKYED